MTDLAYDLVVKSNQRHFKKATPAMNDPMLPLAGLSPVSGKIACCGDYTAIDMHLERDPGAGDPRQEFSQAWPSETPNDFGSWF
jgi:hypothetical protein